MRAMLLAHLSPASPPWRSSKARNVGSASRAILMDSLNAESQGVTLAPHAIYTAFSMTSGLMTDHSMDWNPPIEPPTMKSIFSMPRCSRTRSFAFTMSRTVMRGKSRKYGFPVSGLIVDGPEEPYGEPSMFAQTTKYFSVSKSFPGPTSSGHQSCASEFAVRAWQIHITFLPSPFCHPRSEVW